MRGPMPLLYLCGDADCLLDAAVNDSCLMCAIEPMHMEDLPARFPT